MSKVAQGVGDFAKGFVVGSSDDEASAAQVAGDIVGALVPGLGEVKAIQDIWDGTSKGNPIQVVGGLVGLIPVVGAAGKATSKVATKTGTKAAAKAGSKAGAQALAKAGTKAAAEAGEKALVKAGAEVAEQGLSLSALKFQRATQASVRKTLDDPRTKERLGRIAQESGEKALGRLVDALKAMGDRGESPEVLTRRHDSFDAARDAAFSGMGGRPDKGWHDLSVVDDGGRRAVVGRHDDGRRGFRMLANRPEGDSEQAPLQLYWWKGGEQGKLTFGIEECDASPAAVSRIQEAYLNRDKSFRVKQS